MSISTNYARIAKQLPDYVTIVVSCKTRTAEEIEEVIDAGATDIGENYVQQAGQMYSDLKKKAAKVKWHMIGHLRRDGSSIVTMSFRTGIKAKPTKISLSIPEVLYY